VLHEQAEADTSGEQDLEPAPEQAGLCGELVHALRGRREPPEKVEIERREQHLRRHEPVRDPRDIADIVERLCHRAIFRHPPVRRNPICLVTLV
jgi:hypothetical protein